MHLVVWLEDTLSAGKIRHFDKKVAGVEFQMPAHADVRCT